MHVNIVKLYYFYIILYLYFPLFQICNFLFSNVLFYFSLNHFSYPLSYILSFLVRKTADVKTKLWYSVKDFCVVFPVLVKIGIVL